AGARRATEVAVLQRLEVLHMVPANPAGADERDFERFSRGHSGLTHGDDMVCAGVVSATRDAHNEASQGRRRRLSQGGRLTSNSADDAWPGRSRIESLAGEARV